MSQMPLIPWDDLPLPELAEIVQKIRWSYWHIRNLRGGTIGQARLRKEYRKVAVLKRRLLLSGIEKRTVLDLLACCRLSCSAQKQPFLYCPHCRRGRVLS